MQKINTETLKNLNTLEKLTELFHQLNYQYSGSVLSKRQWKDKAAESAKKLLLVATHQDFHIIYCQIEKLQLGTERLIINQLLKEHPYLLVIFSDSQFTNWHFVNVKYDEDTKQRKIFRRFVIGPDERLHTAAERLSLIEIKDESISPLALQTEHDNAFDVEEVTDEFFSKFVDAFHLLCEEITKNNPAYQSKANEEAQILLNRLVFLYFIQKKGWLDNNKNYLYGKFLHFYKQSPQGYNFYSDFLIKLFQVLSSRNLKFKDLGNVPFLNGGLFEVAPFQSKLPFNLKISNLVFKKTFTNLLEHFNFTVQEDTPLDIEVAIDPEMLGKIFEKLILQLEKDKDLRKATGSYYTPRVIVHFMCQQALKEYLITEWKKYFVASSVEEGKLPLNDTEPQRNVYDLMLDKQEEFHKKKLEIIFSLNPADQLNNEEIEILKDTISPGDARTLREIVKKAFIVDPAAGSGAFLVGMLHEMISFIKLSDICEFGKEFIQKVNYDYELKRQLIETSLYGVDIQEQAVRICELRLWLSLIVDYEKIKNEDVPPLPNLSYKIRCGDSLIEKLFGYNVQLDQLTQTDKGKQLIDEIREDKESYFLERDIREKNRIELSILAKQCELMELLIKEKQKTLPGAQLSIFEERVKERREREEFEKTKHKYEHLLLSATNTRKKVEAMLKGKIPLLAEDIHNLKKKLGISFIWKLDFAEVFKEKSGFDIVIANPPYIRADRGIAHLKYRNEIVDSRIYQTLWEKWDIYIPFIERGMNLLKEDGILEFIVSDAYMTSKYTQRSHDWLAQNKTIKRIDFFPNMKIFDAEVRNIIVQFQNAKNEKNQPHRVKHKDTFENISLLPTGSQRQWGRNIFRIDFTGEKKFEFEDTTSLGDICYISKGMVLNSDENTAKGEFIKANLISETYDKVHCQKYVEAKDIGKYRIDRVRFLEWNTPRVPQKVSRPTFPELYEPPKILRGRMTDATYDGQKLLCNDSIFVIVPFHSLKGVNNKSIQASIAKFNKGNTRNELEIISRNFCLKYLLAVVNSKLAKYFLNSIRRSRIGFYPDDIRKIPIKSADQPTQEEFVILVDTILSIHEQYGCQLPSKPREEIKNLEYQINQKIYKLYELSPEEIKVVEESEA